MTYPKPFKRPGRKTYSFMYADPDGTRRLVSTGCERRSDADDFVRNYVDARSSRSGNITFGEYQVPFYKPDICPHVQRLRDSRRSIGLTHIVKCRQWLDRWIVPDKLFMARPMNRITRGDLLELRGRVRARVKVDSKRIRGDGMNTVNKAMSAVFTVFAEAAFRQHIPANPAADIGNVLYDLEEREVLSLEELEQLFAKPWESRLAFDVFRFAELTGMRCSEILSIVPSAQLRGDVLQVDTAFKGKERGKPKWGKTRTIVLCAAALEILSRRPGGFRYEDGRRLGETWWRDGRIELHYKCLRGRIVSLFALEM